MLTDQNKDTIIQTLTKKIESMERKHPEQLKGAYRRGFSEGMRIEIHVAHLHPMGEVLEPGAEPPVEKIAPDILEAIKTNIRQQIFDKFTPVLPIQIINWIKDSVHEDYLRYNPSFSRKP